MSMSCQTKQDSLNVQISEPQDLLNKNRKLLLENEEKNEIINVLREELEGFKEVCDKYQRENLKLLKDSRRAKLLQDENDFLVDKVNDCERLEAEIEKLREKINDVEFFKRRVEELTEDKSRIEEEANKFESKWQEAENKLHRVKDLEMELVKWKNFYHQLESEKNSIHQKLLDSIEQETNLNLVKKQVEDEVKRLRSLVKYYEDEHEEQASSSLIMSMAEIEQLDQSSCKAKTSTCLDASTMTAATIYESIHQAIQTDDISVYDNSNHNNKEEEEEEEEKALVNEAERKRIEIELDEKETKLSRVLEENDEIKTELSNNKRIISELRQDLACERNLAEKLSKQMSTFTKQIKHLDKHYLPIHSHQDSKEIAEFKKKELTPLVNETIHQASSPCRPQVLARPPVAPLADDAIVGDETNLAATTKNEPNNNDNRSHINQLAAECVNEADKSSPEAKTCVTTTSDNKPISYQVENSLRELENANSNDNGFDKVVVKSNRSFNNKQAVSSCTKEQDTRLSAPKTPSKLTKAASSSALIEKQHQHRLTASPPTLTTASTVATTTRTTTIGTATLEKSQKHQQPQQRIYQHDKAFAETDRASSPCGPQVLARPHVVPFADDAIVEDEFDLVDALATPAPRQRFVRNSLPSRSVNFGQLSRVPATLAPHPMHAPPAFDDSHVLNQSAPCHNLGGVVGQPPSLSHGANIFGAHHQQQQAAHIGHLASMHRHHQYHLYMQQLQRLHYHHHHHHHHLHQLQQRHLELHRQQQAAQAAAHQAAQRGQQAHHKQQQHQQQYQAYANLVSSNHQKDHQTMKLVNNNNNNNNNNNTTNNNKQQQLANGKTSEPRTSKRPASAAAADRQQLLADGGQRAQVPLEVNGLPTVNLNGLNLNGGYLPAGKPKSPSAVATCVSASASPQRAAVKHRHDQQLQQSSSASSASSSSSSSPTSGGGSGGGSESSGAESRTSSNLSPSSSSSCSLGSLSNAPQMSRCSALRHTTTAMPSNVRQFSVERDLVSPLNATLSRVGSCRAATAGPKVAGTNSRRPVTGGLKPSRGRHYETLVELDSSRDKLGVAQLPPSRVSSSAPDKVAPATTKRPSSNGAAVSKSGSSSAVWYEYGCL